MHPQPVTQSLRGGSIARGDGTMRQGIIVQALGANIDGEMSWGRGEVFRISEHALATYGAALHVLRPVEVEAHFKQ